MAHHALPVISIASDLLCPATNCLSWVQIYKELEKMKPWRRRNGTDFVFFFPWSIAHVLDYEHSRPDGGVLQAYLDIVCNQLHRGIHITVENLQVRLLHKVLCTNQKGFL